MVWDEAQKDWYYSIVDVIEILIKRPDTRHAKAYWAMLKKQLNEKSEGQLLTDCKRVKMPSTDGKRHLTEVVNTEQLLHIIQSIAELILEQENLREG